MPTRKFFDKTKIRQHPAIPLLYLNTVLEQHISINLIKIISTLYIQLNALPPVPPPKFSTRNQTTSGKWMHGPKCAPTKTGGPSTDSTEPSSSNSTQPNRRNSKTYVKPPPIRPATRAKGRKRAESEGGTHSCRASRNLSCSGSVQLSRDLVMVYGFRTFLLASSPDPAASDCGCVGGGSGGVLAETIERGESRSLRGISTCGDGRVVLSRSLGRRRWRPTRGYAAPLAVSSCRAAAVRVVWRWRGGVAMGGWGTGVWGQ